MTVDTSASVTQRDSVIIKSANQRSHRHNEQHVRTLQHRKHPESTPKAQSNTTAVLKQLVKMTEAGLSRHENVQNTLSTSHVTKKLMEVYGNQPIMVGSTSSNAPVTPVHLTTPTSFTRRSISMQQPAQQLHQHAYARLRLEKKSAIKDRFASRGTEALVKVRKEDGSMRVESQLQVRLDQLTHPDTKSLSQPDKAHRPPRLLEPILKSQHGRDVEAEDSQNQKTLSFEPGSQMILADNETMIFYPNGSETTQGKAKISTNKKSLSNNARVHASNSKVAATIASKIMLPSPYISNETVALLKGRTSWQSGQSSQNLIIPVKHASQIHAMASLTNKKHLRRKSKNSIAHENVGVLQAAGKAMSSKEKKVYTAGRSTPNDKLANESLSLSRDLSKNCDSFIGLLNSPEDVPLSVLDGRDVSAFHGQAEESNDL